MAGKKKKAPAADGAPDASEQGKSGGGPVRLIMIIVPSLALVAAGYFFGGGGGGSAQSAATVTVTVVEAEPEVGAIVDLEPVNVNLDGGHYLRVAVSLGLTAGEGGGESDGGHGAAEASADESPIPTAPAADIILSTFAGRTVEELSDLEGRIHLREQLEAQLREYYGEDEIVEIYFTEFVMQ